MNKNELIEKAVLKFNGEWPKLIAPWENYLHYKTEVLMGIEWLFSAPDGCHICTREEFNSAADRMRGKPDWKDAPEWAQWLAQDNDGSWYFYATEIPPVVSESCGYFIVDDQQNTRAAKGKCLGDWRSTLEKRPEQKADPLNGYLWGVECHTCGKKPNLPDDVFVQPLINGIHWLQCSHKVSDIDWTVADSFKITDVRYKPSEPEQAEPAPAKPWFEAGELPPVGTICEASVAIREGVYVFKQVEILKHLGKSCACLCIKDEFLKWSDEFRPIKTDKEKAIEAAVKVISGEFEGLLAHVFNTPKDAAEKLYDAGLLRLPDQK